MSDQSPYLSVVVAARNDDHGGNLLRRMQTFVNAWIGQCKRHRLDSELILVEWNPPKDREPLLRALRWPADLGPCCVRIITVPEEVHRRYKHAEALNLYQMIAKNVGIRRAHGQFLLATNIDIIFSDELMAFLAQRRLEVGRMYRIDRYDVMSQVPVDASVDDQLAYCRSHIIRVSAREGVFNVTPDGLRALAERDVAAPDSGISFGRGWYPPYQPSGEDPVHRWASDNAEVMVKPPSDRHHTLIFDLEPGPSVAYKPFVLEVLDRAGSVIVETKVQGRTSVALTLPAHREEREILRFHVIGGGLPVPNDPHILNFRALRCAWADRDESRSSVSQADAIPSKRRVNVRNWAWWPDSWAKPTLRRANPDDIVSASAGLALGAGWCSRELAKGKPFRWVEGEAELIVFTPEGPPRTLIAKAQPGPAVGFKRSLLKVRDQTGRLAASAWVDGTKRVDLPLPWRPGHVQVFSFHLESDGTPVPVTGDPRTLRYRMFTLKWSAEEPGPWEFRNRREDDIAGAEAEIYWGIAWGPPEQDSTGNRFRWARNDAEIAIRAPEPAPGALRVEIEPGPAVGLGPFELHVLDAENQIVARGLVRGRQVIELVIPLCPGRSHVFTMHAEPAGSSMAGDPRTPAFRLFRCGWAPDPLDVLNPELGLAAGAGWSPLELEDGIPFRRVQDGAQLLVQAVLMPERVIELDLEAEPGTGHALDLEIEDGTGETIVKTIVQTRQLVQLALPQDLGLTQTFNLRLKGSGPGIGQLRVFRCDWTGTASRRRSLEFRSMPALPLTHDIVPAGIKVALGKGWYAAEHRGGETYRWAANDAEIIIGSQGERLGTLCLEIEPGPSLGNKPFVLQVLRAFGQAIYEATIGARRKLEVAILVPPAGSCSYRLHAPGPDLPLLGDPRFLSFRVFRCSWTPAGVPHPPASSPAAGAEPDEIVCAEDLHTMACGDFTLLAREHWLDLRGYPEFDLFSMHLDSVFCFAAHHGGAREEILSEPLRIYHIEHAIGSGWTPEGEAKLFERTRAKGLPCLNSNEVYSWATQMRRLNAPMIFNREDWGLVETELREAVLSKESRSVTAP